MLREFAVARHRARSGRLFTSYETEAREPEPEPVQAEADPQLQIQHRTRRLAARLLSTPA